jgi:hypothetical protein
MTKNYVAQMNSGTVTQIIVGDYDWAVAHLAGEWHDLGDEPLTVGIGFTYDAVNDVFVAPVSEVVE